jgi:hypothetical protein
MTAQGCHGMSKRQNRQQDIKVTLRARGSAHRHRAGRLRKQKTWVALLDAPVSGTASTEIDRHRQIVPIRSSQWRVDFTAMT